MNILGYISLLLFIGFSCIHLWDSFYDKQERRKYTKPFLVPFLMGFYLCKENHISLLIVCFLLLCALGDIFLISKKRIFFLIGGTCFLFAHIILIFLFQKRIVLPLLSWPITLLAIIFYFAIGIWVIHSLKPYVEGKMRFVMRFYLLLNALMNTFAIMQLQANYSFAEGIAVLGAFLFFVSDCCLFIVRYHPNKKLIYHNHFMVMLMYLGAMFCITYGILILHL